jgi:hypothetical protein
MNVGNVPGPAVEFSAASGYSSVPNQPLFCHPPTPHPLRFYFIF